MKSDTVTCLDLITTEGQYWEVFEERYLEFSGQTELQSSDS